VSSTRLGSGPCLPNAHAAGVTVVLGACDEEPGLTYKFLAQALDAVVGHRL
jgi:hypothetical protein